MFIVDLKFIKEYKSFTKVQIYHVQNKNICKLDGNPLCLKKYFLHLLYFSITTSSTFSIV